MKKSDAYGALFSSGRKTLGSQNRNLLSVRESSTRKTMLFTPSSLSAERNRRFPSASKSASSRKTMSGAQNLINNKELQHAATAKIRNYFCRQPEFDSVPLYGQQPLSTKIFIEMADFLFCLLLKSSTITHQNYLEQIPIYMKLLGYQGNVQKSWLQVVNTASAFGHVTALLAFLVDLVDWADDSLTLDFLFPPPGIEEDEDETNMLKNCFAHELESFEKWNKCGDEATSLTEENEEMDRFTSQLIKELDINEDARRSVEENIASLEAELNEKSYVYLLNEIEEAENICSSLQKDEETMSLELKKNREFVRNLERDRNEKDKKIPTLELFLTQKTNEVLSLQQQCANQQMTVEERQNIIKKCNELKDSIKCYEDYLQSLKETVFKDEMAIAQLRQEVNKSCLAYNKILMEPAHQFEEINHLRLPPNIFQCDPEASNISHVLRNIYYESEKKKAELEAQLMSAECKNREVEAKLDGIYNHVKEKVTEKMQLKDKLGVVREELDELRKVCEKNESDVMAEICSKNEVLSSYREREEEVRNLKKLKEEKAIMIENAERRRQEMSNNLSRQGYLLLNFFTQRCQAAVDSIHKEHK